MRLFPDVGEEAAADMQDVVHMAHTGLELDHALRQTVEQEVREVAQLAGQMVPAPE